MTSWRKALFLEPGALSLLLIIVIAGVATIWFDRQTGEVEPVERTVTSERIT